MILCGIDPNRPYVPREPEPKVSLVSLGKREPRPCASCGAMMGSHGNYRYCSDACKRESALARRRGAYLVQAISPNSFQVPGVPATVNTHPTYPPDAGATLYTIDGSAHVPDTGAADPK